MYVAFSVVRTNDFPTSLGGKGHDTAVVCRWLQHALEQTGPQPYHIYVNCIQIMRYTVSCANAIFDILHQNGVFLPARAKHRAIILFRDVCAF